MFCFILDIPLCALVVLKPKVPRSQWYNAGDEFEYWLDFARNFQGLMMNSCNFGHFEFCDFEWFDSSGDQNILWQIMLVYLL